MLDKDSSATLEITKDMYGSFSYNFIEPASVTDNYKIVLTDTLPTFVKHKSIFMIFSNAKEFMYCEIKAASYYALYLIYHPSGKKFGLKRVK